MQQGYLITDNLTYVLNTGKLTFYSDNNEPIVKNTLIQIDDLYMLVNNDNVNFYDKTTYQHDLTLVELKDIFSNWSIDNLILSDSEEFLLLQLGKALVNINTFNQNQINYEIVYDELEDFKVKGEFFSFSDSLAIEVLEEIMKAANKILQVNVRVDDKITWLITCRDPYKKGNKITIANNKTFLTNYLYDNQNNAGSILIKADNAYSNIPITEDFQPLKTTETVLTSNNAVIQTMFPVELITQTRAKVNISYSFTAIQGTEGTTRVSVNGLLLPVIVDISPSLVRKEVYDVSSASDKKKLLYYESEQNSVNVDIYKRVFFSYNKLFNILETAANTYGLDHQEELIAKAYQDGYLSSINYQIETMKSSHIYGTTDSEKYSNLALQLTYYAYNPVRFNPRKANKSALYSSMQVQDKQSSAYISSERLGNYAYNKVKLLGNNQLIIQQKYSNLNDIPKLNDYTNDNYIVIKRELSVYKNIIEGVLTLSKDYTNYDTRIACQKDKSIYQIGLSYQECIIPIFYNAYVSTSLPNEYANTNGICPLRNLAYSLINENQNQDINIKRLIFKTSSFGTEYGWFCLPSASYVGGNEMHFVSKCYDNYSVALSIGGSVIGGKRVAYNPYVNSLGKINKITCAFSYEQDNGKISVADIQQLPNIDYNVYSNSLTDQYELEFYKDEKQALGIDFCVRLESDNNIFINKEYFTNNCLIKKSQDLKSYDIYMSTSEKYNGSEISPLGDKLGKANEIMTDFDKTLENINYAFLKFRDNISTTNMKSYAFTLDNKVVVAVNSNSRILYFTKRKEK